MKPKTYLFMVLLLVCSAAAVADGHRTMAPEGARVYFITPQDGATVTQNFTVKFGLAGMGVAPAGVVKQNTGHHHLLIDTDIASIDMSKGLGKSDKIKHFGGGQTETQLQLTPGKHTLQLLLGDHAHVPHVNPVISEKITVTVE